MSASFKYFGIIPDNIQESSYLNLLAILLKRSFINGAMESLQFLRIFAGMTLSILAFLGFKERVFISRSFRK